MRPGSRRGRAWGPGMAFAGLLGCHHAALPPKPDGAAVVVADDVPSDVPSVEEKEPNDSLATATALTFGDAAGLTVRAELEVSASKGHGVDLYRLTIPPSPVLVADTKSIPGSSPGDAGPGDGGLDAGVASPRQRLAVVVETKGGTLVVEALDDKGNVLMADGSSAEETAGFPNWSVLPGTYFLRVRTPPPPKAPRGGPARAAAGGASGTASAAAVPYKVSLRLSTPEPGEETEPNGKPASAQTATSDDELAGYYGWRRDEDWYRVDVAGVPEGNLLSLDLTPVPGVAGSLAIFDLAEHRLMDRKGRKDESLSIRDLAWPKGESAVYVVVRAEAGKNPGERYRLRVRNQPVSPETETEPNDDAAHALPLAEGSVQGTLGRGDVDLYRFKLDEPRVAALEVTPPERVDVRVDVLRENGGASVLHLDQGKRHEPEAIPNLFLVPGAYLLRLSTAPGDGNGDEPYQVTFSLRSAEPGEEREPNDVGTRATLLSAGAAARGWLAPRGDVDVWRIDHPASRGAATLGIEGVPDLGLEVKVTTAASKEVGHAAVGAGAQGVVQIPAGVEGCCFIQIREKSGKLMNSRDSYGLTLSAP